MSRRSFFLRFPDERARDAFTAEVRRASLTSADQVIAGLALPDVVVREVTDRQAEALIALAGPQAEFFEDIQFGVPPLVSARG